MLYTRDKPRPVPFSFVVKNGSNSFGKVILVNTFARVLDPDLDFLAVIEGAALDGQRAFSVHGLSRVENDVQKDLLEEVRVGEGRRQGRVQSPLDLDIVEERLLDQQRQGLFDHVIDVHQPGLILVSLEKLRRSLTILAARSASWTTSPMSFCHCSFRLSSFCRIRPKMMIVPRGLFSS